MTYADLTFGATEGFDFRWNYSIGSNTFLYSGFNGGNPCTINMQGNVILDYTGGSHAIAIRCNGPMNLIDNTVRTLSANTSNPSIIRSLERASSALGIRSRFLILSGPRRREK